MASRKDYEAIAEIIRENTFQPTKEMLLDRVSFIDAMANYFETDKPRFDREKFLDACDLE